MRGGTTPSAGCIEVVRDSITIGLQVIIRPRGGDFLYDDREFAMMKKDIQVAKDSGADGVVVGLLSAQGYVDRDRTQELIGLARPMNVTFHRAFDMTVDPFRALEDLIELGVDRILTSGQRASAWDGVELIKALVERAEDRIIIMPGGGVDENNIAAIVQHTGVSECHVSGRTLMASTMEYRNHQAFMGGTLRLPEYERKVASPQRIQTMKYQTN